MKVFVLFIFTTTLVLAEPPVGNGYPASHSTHDHQHDQEPQSQRSISTEYGTPSSRSFDTQGYGATDFRSGVSQTYGPPGARSQNYKGSSIGLPQGYGAPKSQLSSRYGTPALRNSISQDYRAPARTNLSPEYGLPNVRENFNDYDAITQGISNTYLPTQKGSKLDYSRMNEAYNFQRSSPSLLSGPQNFRSTPAEEYGVPAQNIGASQGYASSSLRNSPSQSYGVPAFSESQFRSSLSRQYGVPKSRSNDLSQVYGAPQTASKSAISNFIKSSSRKSPSQNYGPPASRSLSTQYGAPSVRNLDTYNSEYDVPSETYGTPNQRSLSDSYSVPDERSLSQEYAAPRARDASLKTNAIASTYSSARSSLSQTYGVPSGRASMPSDQYGVPDQYSNLFNQGYGYARNSLDDLNQEPANYDFAYKVIDDQSGSDYGHTESRQDNKAEGAYFVVLPDGTKQVVEYEADETGFKPKISVEPADRASAGYDENAADLALSGGPY